MDNSAPPPTEQELPEVYKKLLNDPNASFLDKYGKYFLLFSLIFLIFVLGSKYISSKDKQKQVTIVQPTIVPISFSPSPTSDPITDWKTYRNANPSFRIKYPPEVVADNLGSNPPLVVELIYYGSSKLNSMNALGGRELNDGYFIKIDWEDGVQAATLEKAVQNFLAFYNNMDKDKQLNLTDLEVTNLNGIQAYKFETKIASSSTTTYFTSNGTKNFQIHLIARGTKADQQTYINTMQQIISTFKFLDQMQVSIPPPTQEPTFCTEDARQCPDGSWVGRTGPNCEFVCPSSLGE